MLSNWELGECGSEFGDPEEELVACPDCTKKAAPEAETKPAGSDLPAVGSFW